jgi:hypothetical protein
MHLKAKESKGTPEMPEARKRQRKFTYSGRSISLFMASHPVMVTGYGNPGNPK